MGVDGGGTKTDCAVIDASTGEVVGQAVAGASNWWTNNSQRHVNVQASSRPASLMLQCVALQEQHRQGCCAEEPARVHHW